MTSLSKICLHWTGGNNYPCDKDLDSYHFCVDKDGKIYKGTYEPEDNINCQDGIYARHCGGGNTGCIGISACGMKGFTERKILINEKQVFTHYEFDQRKQKPEGKIDIIYIPYLPNLQINRIGGYFRNKIEWYKQQIKKGKYKLQKKGNYYEFVSVF